MQTCAKEQRMRPWWSQSLCRVQKHPFCTLPFCRRWNTSGRLRRHPWGAAEHCLMWTSTLLSTLFSSTAGWIPLGHDGLSRKETRLCLFCPISSQGKHKEELEGAQSGVLDPWYPETLIFLFICFEYPGWLVLAALQQVYSMSSVVSCSLNF